MGQHVDDSPKQRSDRERRWMKKHPKSKAHSRRKEESKQQVKSRCVQSRRNEPKSELMVQKIEDEDPDVPDDGLPIHVENKIKFLTAEALQRYNSHIFDVSHKESPSRTENS